MGPPFLQQKIVEERKMERKSWVSLMESINDVVLDKLNNNYDEEYYEEYVDEAFEEWYEEFESELEEGSIKGSGTDRKAQLKKAYRAGEQKTRDFYKNKITKDPKTSDKGVKKAFDAGKNAGDGNPTPQGAARSKPRDSLAGTEHGRSEPSTDIFGNKGKTHYKTQTHSQKMYGIAKSNPKGRGGLPK